MEGKVIVGECSAVMAERLPDGAIDLVVTSPPYDDLRVYEGYSFDFDAVARQILRVLRPGGACVWVVGDKYNGSRSCTSFRQVVAFQDMGFHVHDVMIYQKRNTPFMRSNAYTPAYELMVVLSKGGPPKTFNPLVVATQRSGRETAVYAKGTDGDNSKRRGVTLGTQKVRTNVWPYAVGLGGTTRDRWAFEHKAMFPEQLAGDHILSWSNPGELVLDPMCGSGTTLKMAKVYGRRWIGIEISAKYAKLARRRVKEARDGLV